MAKRKTLNDPELLALADETIHAQSVPGVLSVGPNVIVKVHFRDVEVLLASLKQSTRLLASYHASGATFGAVDPWRLSPVPSKLMMAEEYFTALRGRLVSIHEEYGCISGNLCDVAYFAFGPYCDKHNLKGITFKVDDGGEVYLNLDMTEERS